MPFFSRSKTDSEISRLTFIRAEKETDIVTLLQLIPAEGIRSSAEFLDIILDKVIKIGKTSVMREVCLRSQVDEVTGVDLLMMEKARYVKKLNSHFLA